MKSLLLVEDDPIMGESLLQRFQIEGFEVSWARRLSEATADGARQWDAVVCDVRLPDGLATEWFAKLPADVRARPWFFLTGYGSVDDAVAAIRAGAREYLTKPFDIERLVELVQGSMAALNQPDDDVVLGVSVAMRRVEAMVRKVASQRVSVLLTGESGVGKEVAAQLIHRLDPRSAQGPFIAVNCAAVPETMVRPNSSATRKVPSRAPSACTRGSWNGTTEARCFWTRWASCRRPCRPSCCVPCRSGVFSVWDRSKPPAATSA